MNVKISVIMPAYNAENCCRQAIQSVLDQSFTDFELIVIDDGSLDNTYRICMELSEKDGRVRVIHQSNGGVSAARNTGLNESNGDYVCFVDSDDYAEETMLDELYTATLKRNADFVVCGFKSYVDGNVVGQWIPESTNDLNTLCGQLLKSDVGMNPLWNKMFKRNLISNSFNTQKSMGEDLEFICEFLKTAESCTVVQEPLYRYLLDFDNSLTKNKESILHALVDDMAERDELIKYRGLIGHFQEDRLYEQIEGTLARFITYRDFCEAFDVLEREQDVCKLINRLSPLKRKNKVIRYMMQHKLCIIMFGYLRLKANVRKVIR